MYTENMHILILCCQWRCTYHQIVVQEVEIEAELPLDKKQGDQTRVSSERILEKGIWIWYTYYIGYHTNWRIVL